MIQLKMFVIFNLEFKFYICVDLKCMMHAGENLVPKPKDKVEKGDQ